MSNEVDEPDEARDEPVESTPSPPDDRPRTIVRAFGELAWWKQTLFFVALLLFVGGLALGTFAGSDGDAGDAGPVGGAATAPGASGLVDGSIGGTGESEADDDASGLGPYSPGMVKIGFGFVAGLSLGLFLRNFLRLTLSFVGLVLLAILGLEYVGFVQVHWEALGQGFDNLVAGLGDQFESFKTFVTGRIPATGSALAGLWAGFRRK